MTGRRLPCCRATPTSISAATSGCCARMTNASCWKSRCSRPARSRAGRGATTGAPTSPLQRARPLPAGGPHPGGRQGAHRAHRPFTIGQDLLASRCLSDLIHYFRGSAPAAPSIGPIAAPACLAAISAKTCTAAGMTPAGCEQVPEPPLLRQHLQPQQTPMVVWSLLKCRELLAPRQDIDGVNLCKRLNDEALHGADFLCRMQDESGFFYMTLFDKWSKDPAQRELCAYATQQGIKSAHWQAGFRQGAAWPSRRSPAPPARASAATLMPAVTPRRPVAATCTCVNTTSPTWTTGSKTSSTTTAPCWPPSN